MFVFWKFGLMINFTKNNYTVKRFFKAYNQRLHQFINKEQFFKSYHLIADFR